MSTHRGMSEADLAEAADMLTDAFAEYPIEMAFTRETLSRVCRADDVVLEACALARGPGGRLVGVALAAIRGDRGRIAAMGVARRAHRQGLGTALGEAVLGSLRDHGVKQVCLEALTVNAAALALYERHLGFSRRRRLVGFTRPAGRGSIDPADWEAALARDSEPDSWQLARVVQAIRAQDDIVSVPAVVPEHHPVAQLLRAHGFAEAEIDQYELDRSL